VVSCYEAGRDGFWLHRCLEGQGVRNLVVDPASIEVNRRKRRAKTDGIDLKTLFDKLLRYDQGQKDVWRVVVVPKGGRGGCTAATPGTGAAAEGSDAAQEPDPVFAQAAPGSRWERSGV